MGGVGPLVLLPALLGSLGVAAACFVLGLWRAKGEDPNEAATSSTGTEMRRRLQLLLLLANVARALGLAVETVLFEDGACPGAWTCALVRGGPDLLFLTTYSMLILFWAQLSHTATGSPFPLLRPAFLVSNGLLYLAFLLIVVLSASSAISPAQFVQALFHLLGLFYILATVCLLKYGLRMMRFSQLALPPVLRRRLVLLCAVCSAAFLLHALYYLAVAAQVALAAASPDPDPLLAHGGYPPARFLPGGSAFAFDALFYPFMELIPSAAILFALHHKRRAYLDSSVVPYSKISSGGGVGVGLNGASYGSGGAGNGGGGGGGGGGLGLLVANGGAAGLTNGPNYGAMASGLGMGGAGSGLGGAGIAAGGTKGGQFSSYQQQQQQHQHQQQHGSHLHPSLYGAGSVVVREGNHAGLMMGMIHGLLDGRGGGGGLGGPGATPSTSSGSTRSEV